MPRRRAGARILGPYQRRGEWYYWVINEEGGRTFAACEDQTPEGAKREVEQKRARLIPHLSAPQEVTVSTAIERYEEYLRDVKKNKPKSYRETVRRLRRFFEGDRGLTYWTVARVAKRYEEFAAGVSVDYH